MKGSHTLYVSPSKPISLMINLLADRWHRPTWHGQYAYKLGQQVKWLSSETHIARFADDYLQVPL